MLTFETPFICGLAETKAFVNAPYICIALECYLVCSRNRSVYKRPIDLHCETCKINGFRRLVTLLTMQVYGAFINASVSASQQLKSKRRLFYMQVYGAFLNAFVSATQQLNHSLFCNYFELDL